MTDPRDKAGAVAPPTLGEGCLARFDPDALSDEDGTEFPGAAELWDVMNCADEPCARQVAKSLL
ncbi:hypothetical protein P5705_07835 [Pseudomonas entomophila]|uniref:hypothetical protein n=1 Tax=Pseudomonas entomophila TaxID=312306 RepID=UPI0024056B41|nr:hypothetical protein [Pseudomonas entomophila]MDF9617550.1 hypothetical protein [Pseudomonas entomophila]